MPLTPEQRDMVASELKGFAADLNLSEDQKQKLQISLSEAAEKVQEYKEDNPGASKEDLLKKLADNRAAIRQRVVTFLSAEQLTKWDAAVGKAKEFLSQRSQRNNPGGGQRIAPLFLPYLQQILNSRSRKFLVRKPRSLFERKLQASSDESGITKVGA